MPVAVQADIANLTYEDVQELLSNCTPMQVKFINEYLTNGFNVRLASVSANIPVYEGHFWLTDNVLPVRGVILWYLSKYLPDPVIILAKISEAANVDMSDYWTITTNSKGKQVISFDYQKALDNKRTHLIKKMRVGKDGISVDLLDPMKALELLAKIQTLFKDGSDTNVWNIDYSTLTEEQLARLARGESPNQVILGNSSNNGEKLL